MIIALDTNCVIYLIEKNPVWEPKVSTRLATARAAGDQLAVCDLARAECLIGPLALRGAGRGAGHDRILAGPPRRRTTGIIEIVGEGS